MPGAANICVLFFSGGLPCTDVKLNVVNLNKQGKLYNQGMAPVYKISPGPNRWERVRDYLSFDVSILQYFLCLLDFTYSLTDPIFEF